ncbi:hypothetical protein M3J09_012458 [Ascochyta lentis]
MDMSTRHRTTRRGAACSVVPLGCSEIGRVLLFLLDAVKLAVRRASSLLDGSTVVTSSAAQTGQ